MKSERDVLQDDVFPRLKQLCLSNGLRFQPIDLRWGVPEEAGKDNRTMRICLRELKRCQHGSPKPNFLILLGDRYGWRPLPETIPADLFAQLRGRLPTAMQELFEWRDSQPADGKGWYRRDDNSVPPVYELRPRGDGERWHDTVEQPLLHALEAAAREIGLDAETQGVAIGTSATEQEIIEGALKVNDASEHVHAFFRSISGLPHDPWPQDFADTSNDGTPDSVAKRRLDNLKAQIKAKIGANVHRYSVPWHDGVQTSDLLQFSSEVYAALKGVILRQTEELTSASREAQEEEAHRAFGDERRQGFIGRTEPLERIAAYLGGSDHGVLAVVGSSGSGKSAVMAEAVRRARETYGEDAVLARFIGATPDSANILALLGNLVAEIRRRYPAPPPFPGEKSKDGEIPVDINPLTVAFHAALTRPTAERPLLVFLDALDQLASGSGAWECHWLPGTFNPHVRLILSVALPAATDARGEGVAVALQRFLSAQDPRPVVMSALELRASQVQQIRLQPLSTADGQKLVAQWLADAGRTLQPAQDEAILAAFLHEGSPLWMRVAVTESERLASWDSSPKLDPGLPGIMRQVLERLSAEDEHGAVLVERALAGIASARHGLAEDEVMDVLSDDLEVMADFRRRSPKSPPRDTLPAAVWVRLRGDIAPYLAERQLQNATLLGFYHRSLLEAAQAAFLANAETRLAAHERLNNYFRKRSWFIAPVDEQGLAQREGTITDPPDARKASELPWQLVRAADAADSVREQSAEWDAPVAVLCDIEFVEAKCRSGLVFELQEDYRDARSMLPDARAILQEERHRAARITQWTGEIIRYSQAWSERRDRIARGERVDEAEPVLPEPPPSCRMWTDEEIEAECQRIREAPTRLDRLAAFEGFVQSECYPLVHLGGREGFALQHAINYALGGPVHVGAHRLLPQCSAPLLLRRWPKKDTWNPKPAMLRTLEGHRNSVTDVSVTADGRRAVSGSEDYTVRVWNLESGSLLRVLGGHRMYVASVSVTPDGRRAISGSWDKTVRVWDLESGACLGVLEGHTDTVTPISVTPDGRRAVSASYKTMRVWDLESGACLRVLEGHSGFINSLSVTPDGRRAMSASSDTVRVWDLESGACLRVLEGHSGTVVRVSVTPDGRRAVSGSLDKTVRVWDLESGVCLRTLEGHSGFINTLSVTPDGRRAVSAGSDTVWVWDLESGVRARALEGHLHTVTSVSVTADGRRAVSGSEDRTVRVWDLESGVCLRTVDRLGNGVISVSVAANGLRAVLQSADRTVRVWDLGSGTCLRTLDGLSDGVMSVTADGLRAVSGSMDSVVRVRDLESWACIRALEVPFDPEEKSPGRNRGVASVSVTPDGRRAVSGSWDKTVRVWDLECGVCLHTLEGHSSTVASVSVTPDGRRAVSGSWDKTVRVWDLECGVCLHALEGHSGYVTSVSVTPDGRRAVSGSHDAQIRVWDDKTVRVWDLESGACVAVFAAPAPVSAVAISPEQLILGTEIGQVLFLEMRNLPLVATVAPVLSGEAYEALLRRSLDHSRRKKGLYHKETLAHITALTVHLEKMGKTDEAVSLKLSQPPPTSDGTDRRAGTRRELTPAEPFVPRGINDADRAEQLTLQYKVAKRQWRALPWWKRLRTPKPKPPSGT